MDVKKRQKGITLISLVVTIVVLLILAGITISTVFSDNGIIKKAQEARNKTLEAVAQEHKDLNQLYNDLEAALNSVPSEPVIPKPPEGAVQISEPNWSNGTASVTITTSETGFTLQYQIGGVDEAKWTNITSGKSISDLTLGQTIYARLYNGKEGSKTADMTIADLNKPQDAGISLSGTSTNTEGSITATVTLKDNESGVNAISSRWIYNTTSGAIGENESSYTGGSFSSGQTITLKATTAGTYYLHVLTVDNAGNKKETISSAVTVEAALVADGNYNASKGVNTPKLGSGMTPIKWNGSSWVNTTGSDKEWYDYTSKKWANAKTSDGSMWVWIPRYAYSITSGYHSSSAGNIDVEFMKGLTNETSTGRKSFNNASGQGKWNIHPAFNYGQTVSGIWVAKFEASNSGGKIKVEPGVQSWRSITVNDIYTNCLNYNKTLNSHMMKNDEWGAVAYLSKSKYGKNAEVDINSDSSYYTGGGSGNAYVTNVGQSTTGTVHGVYDMSGGAWEYVAAYVNNGNSNLTNYGSSLVNGDAKTKNVYSKGSSDSRDNNYSANSGKYGDAVYETSANGNSSSSSWYGDCSNFPYTSGPFFERGGNYNNGTGAGVFYFSNSNGISYGGDSFRPVLVTL